MRVSMFPSAWRGVTQPVRTTATAPASIAIPSVTQSNAAAMTVAIVIPAAMTARRLRELRELLLDLLARQREADDIERERNAGGLELLRRLDRIAAARLLAVGDDDDRAAAGRLQIRGRLEDRVDERRLAARNDAVDRRDDLLSIEFLDRAQQLGIRARLFVARAEPTRVDAKADVEVIGNFREDVLQDLTRRRDPRRLAERRLHRSRRVEDDLEVAPRRRLFRRQLRGDLQSARLDGAERSGEPDDRPHRRRVGRPHRAHLRRIGLPRSVLLLCRQQILHPFDERR